MTTRYKLEKFYKIDTAAFSKERALSEAKKIFTEGNKKIFKINVVEKRDGVESIIKTFERRVKKKTKTKPETEK
jgi:hypothetical protein